MSVLSLGSASTLTSAGSTAATTTAAAGNSAPLTQSDFLNLLTTQMQYQDPMDPVSASDFASQLAQFASLQGVTQLNTSITQLLTSQQVSQGANLIGKTVTYTNDGNSPAASGVVSGVQLSNGAVQLQVGNQSVALSQLTSIAGTGT
jgi:flagellar basal-body rod modification protein FlgD